MLVKGTLWHLPIAIINQPIQVLNERRITVSTCDQDCEAITLCTLLLQGHEQK